MKKTMKILAFVASLVLILVGLTGCGKKTNTENNSVENSVEENKTEELERGDWKDNVYTNEFADITFTLPEGWSYEDDEGIAEMMDIGVELLNEEQQKLAEIAQKTGFYDMVANNMNTGSSVMIMFEKPLLDVTEDFYLNKLNQNLEEIETMHYEVSADITTETVAGREYRVSTATVPEYNMVQKYYVEKKGDYFVVILVSYIETLDSENNILSNFQ